MAASSSTIATVLPMRPIYRSDLGAAAHKVRCPRFATIDRREAIFAPYRCNDRLLEWSHQQTTRRGGYETGSSGGAAEIPRRDGACLRRRSAGGRPGRADG